MIYQALLYTHLFTVLAAFPIGAWLLLNRKGTKVHRYLGRPYVGLMMITAVASLAMPAALGPNTVWTLWLYSSFQRAGPF